MTTEQTDFTDPAEWGGQAPPTAPNAVDSQGPSAQDEPAESSTPSVRVAGTWTAMIELVPDAGQDGVMAILEQLAQATDASQLDEPWRANGLGELAGRPMAVLSIAKMAAEFDGPIPFFLIVKAAMADTGELVTATTGAVSVVGQLVKAHALGAFPWPVVLRIAERPSAAGFYPQHLDVIRGPQAEAIRQAFAPGG